jgi:Spy/CpxP family protein refolding chaperone
LDPRLLDQLSLTDEQKVLIGKIQESSRASSLAYFEKLRAAETQLRELAGPDSFNESAARKALNAKAQITVELDLIRLRGDAGIYNVLTPEQISQAETLKSQRPEGHRPPPPDGFRPPPTAKN